MKNLRLFAVALSCLIGACAPCSEDKLEPNNSLDSPADGGEMTTSLNELDLNFHDQEDVDCVSFHIADPSNAEEPRSYVEILDVDEDVELTLHFSCDSGDAPSFFACNGEEPDEPTCAKGGSEPNLGFTYDCDATDDLALGDATLVACMARPSPDKLCVDYTIRAYLN